MMPTLVPGIPQNSTIGLVPAQTDMAHIQNVLDTLPGGRLAGMISILFAFVIFIDRIGTTSSDSRYWHH
jgi:hypothetical protein